MKRFTSDALRKLIRDAVLPEPARKPRPIASPMSNRQVIEKHIAKALEFWEAEVSEIEIAIDWSEAHERCWICADKFTKSQLARGPLVKFGEQTILACYQCEPLIEERLCGMTQGEEVRRFRKWHLDNRNYVRKIIGALFDNMYISDRTGSLRYAEFIEKKEKLFDERGPMSVSIEVRCALETLKNLRVSQPSLFQPALVAVKGEYVVGDEYVD